MSERTHYPPGVPCWVNTLQHDPDAAATFYGELFGWRFAGPGRMPDTPGGKYYVARRRGRDVAGVASMPHQSPPSAAIWNTHVRVADAGATCSSAERAGGSVVVPPFDVLPAGRMAVIADRAGATLSLWEPKDRAGAQVINEPSAWAMSALLAPHAGDAEAFYGAVFGWQADTFEAGGTTVTLWRLPGYFGGEPQQPVPRDVVGVMMHPLPPNVPPHWSVNFWIDDVARAAATAASLGGSVVSPPHDEPGFRRCLLADPQGAVFSLSQLVGFS